MVGNLSFQELRTVLDEVSERAHSETPPFVTDNRRWTEEIMERLGRLGKEKGFYVCANGIENKNWGEWLYDMTWLEYAGSEHFRRIPLAVESEWGDTGDVRDDFQKLVVSRAECRVMIFQAGSAQKMNERLDMLRESVETFCGSAATDLYYCACYRIDLRKFSYPDHAGIRINGPT